MFDPLAESVMRKIRDEFHPDKIFLFGSRARGDARPDSDVDVIIVYSGNMSKRELKIAVGKLFIPRTFGLDVLVITPKEYEAQRFIPATPARLAELEGVEY